MQVRGGLFATASANRRRLTRMIKRSELLRCDEGQGYLFSKPVPCDVLGSLIGRDPERKHYVVADSKPKVVSEFPSAVRE